MAEGVVSFLLGKLDSLLVKEVQLLRGVRREIVDIKDELESITSFLRDADARGENEEGVRTWVKQVRDVAYDMEDILDDFTLRLPPPTHYSAGCMGGLRNSICSIINLKARKRLANQIQDIKVRVHEINRRRERYNFTSVEQGETSSGGGHGTRRDPRVASLFMEEADIVGIEQPREKLIGWLVDGEPRRTVISVVGMAGLGKTTLVRNVYDEQRVKKHFESHAWITVSQCFNIEELFRDLLKQFFMERNEAAPQHMDTMKEVQLIRSLKDCLQHKRYVVVCDDVWSVKAWECIKIAFPNGECGSRIMITTQISDVGSFSVESFGHLHDLQPLPPNEAWSLFCKRAFQGNYGGFYPPDQLVDLSQKIVSRCGGLPLAIVAIAGLLSIKEKTFSEWDKVHRSLRSLLERNPFLNDMKMILSLSYSDLPYHLKCCFLYFAIFPEDFSISCKRLIRLWIAEGFVEAVEGKNLDEVGEEYLSELIGRSMVQVAELHRSGKVRTCRIHDLMREIILSKSREESFSFVFNDQSTNFPDRIRRLSIYNSAENYLPNQSSNLRSLFMFGVDKFLGLSSINISFSSFGLLKILDLEDALSENFPNELQNLVHLRYLSLKNSKITIIPKSIGKLKNLETLNLRGTNIIELPVEILKLVKLRHLTVIRLEVLEDSPRNVGHGVEVPVGIGKLKALQQLSRIDATSENGIIRELENLTQLKKLGITKLRKDDGMNLCASIGKMKYLQFFMVSSIHEGELLDLQSLLSPPPHLQVLDMQGLLEKLPPWIPSLQNLLCLSLRISKLRDDPLTALQSLPNLVYLKLDEAFLGERLCFESGVFKRLTRLVIERMDRLNLVRVEEGAMSNLQFLKIRRCLGLWRVPLGTEHLTNLKDFKLLNMPEDLVRSIRKGDEGEDRWRVKTYSPHPIYTYSRMDRGIPFIISLYASIWRLVIVMEETSRDTGKQKG